MTYPMNVDTSDWRAFGTFDRDQVIDRERRAWSHFSVDRIRKGARKGVTPTDVFTGGVYALVQILFAQHDNCMATEEDRQKMHQMFDFAWLQAEAMARDMNKGKTQ